MKISSLFSIIFTTLTELCFLLHCNIDIKSRIKFISICFQLFNENNTYFVYYLGNQTWECSSNINEIFTTPEPIRDDCIEGWIDDIGDLLDNENIPSSNISDTIEKNLANATSGITGKGLIELSKDLDRLMNKRYDEIGR